MDSLYKDIIGVGIGPANLALATALQEQFDQSNHDLNSLFLDKDPNFSWHTGMLLPGSSLQVPFIRDLATLRNPQSPYTFLNYLKQAGRLDLFINLRTFFPSRLEFQQYLSWVCKKLSHLMQFNSEVKNITAIKTSETSLFDQLQLNYYDSIQQKHSIIQTKNIIIGAGKKPYIPSIAQIKDNRIIHTDNLLHQLEAQYADKNNAYCFTVVGSGQSAGEVVLYLLQHYPNSSINWCFRRYVLHATDNSPYINREYHADAIEKFYDLSCNAKQLALQDMQNSNYAVVENDILNTIFSIQYADQLNNKKRLYLYPGSTLTAIATEFDDLHLTIQQAFEENISTITSNALILATGYENTPLGALLSQLEPFLLKNPDGTYQIDKNYCLKTIPEFTAKIYLQGYCEHTHGSSDPTLATLATKAEIILQSILRTDKQD